VSVLFISSSSPSLTGFLKPTPRQKTNDAPGPGRDLATEVETGTGTEIAEAGLVLDTVASIRTGRADPIHIAQAVHGRPGGETTGAETAGVVTTEGSQDPTPGHALPEGIGIEDMPGMRTKRNSLVMMTSPRNLFELLPWKSKVGAMITRLR
jgi:hypothetical protein